MDIFTIRQQLRTTRLSDIPLRVTFYARVSTDSDEQLNSLDNQIGYYRDLYHPQPCLDVHRRLYRRRSVRHDDAQARQLPAHGAGREGRTNSTLFSPRKLPVLPATRSTASSYTRAAAFRRRRRFLPERQHQHVRRGFRAAPVHHVRLSRRTSCASCPRRVKFGHQQAIKTERCTRQQPHFRLYESDDGRLVIDETEAPMVRELFELYATDQYSHEAD